MPDPIDEKRVAEITRAVLETLDDLRGPTPAVPPARPRSRFRSSLSTVRENWVIVAFLASVVTLFAGSALTDASPLQRFHRMRFEREQQDRQMAQHEVTQRMVARHIELGDAFTGDGNLEVAQAEYRAALELDPYSVEARMGLAKASVFGGDDFDPEVVERRIRQLLRDSANHRHLYYLLGRVHHYVEPESAAAHYRHALRIDSTVAGAWFALGVMLDEANEPDSAMAMYERALSLSPWNQRYLNNIAYQMYRAGRYDDAIAHYRRLLGLDERYLLSYYLIGNAYRMTGDAGRALAWHRELLHQVADTAVTALERNGGSWFFHVPWGRVYLWDLEQKRWYALHSAALSAWLAGFDEEAAEYLARARRLEVRDEWQLRRLVEQDAERLVRERLDWEPAIRQYRELRW